MKPAESGDDTMLIALGIVCALLLLLCIPVAAAVVIGENTAVDVCWLFLRVRVYPQGEKKVKAPKKAAGPPAPKKEPPKKKNPFQDMELCELAELASQAVATAGELLKSVLRNLRVRRLVVDATVAGEDAAAAAIAYGRMWAVLSGAMSVLQNCITIIDPQFHIQPDFLGEKSAYTVSFRASLTPLIVLGAALRAAVRLLWLLLKSGLVGGGAPRKEQDLNNGDASRPANKKECVPNE